mmetsp:Transcript_8375/g.17750  ORF Transcript_8375/g.17750 Transcript_8375/m.17750 type:complete len:124 (+) Transcript_8375:3-374(+)
MHEYRRICLACCLAAVALPSTPSLAFYILLWLRSELKMHRSAAQPSDSSAPALIQTVIVRHSSDVCFLVGAGSLHRGTLLADIFGDKRLSSCARADISQGHAKVATSGHPSSPVNFVSSLNII